MQERPDEVNPVKPDRSKAEQTPHKTLADILITVNDTAPRVLVDTGANLFRNNNTGNWKAKLEKDPQLKLLLQERLANFPIVDLGCGPVSNSPKRGREVGVAGALPRMAEQLSDAEIQTDYFGIDYKLEKYAKEVAHNASGDRTDAIGVVRDIGSVHISGLVDEDILTFAKQLQNGSVNIVINGIDTSVIDDDGYHAELLNQIARAVPAGGIVMGDNSAVFNQLTGKSGLGAPADVVAEYWDKKFRILSNKGGTYVVERLPDEK